jgi:hypothetical protein
MWHLTGLGWHTYLAEVGLANVHLPRIVSQVQSAEVGEELVVAADLLEDSSGDVKTMPNLPQETPFSLVWPAQKGMMGVYRHNCDWRTREAFEVFSARAQARYAEPCESVELVLRPPVQRLPAGKSSQGARISVHGLYNWYRNQLETLESVCVASEQGIETGRSEVPAPRERDFGEPATEEWDRPGSV